MSDDWHDRGRRAGKVIKRSAEVSANSFHKLKEVVVRNEDRVADKAQAVTETVGGGLNKAGHEMSRLASDASRSLHGNASNAGDAVRNAITGSRNASTARRTLGFLGGTATKLLAHAAGLTADAISVVGKVVESTGQFAEKSAPALGGTVGGVVRGAADVGSNMVDAVALTATKIDEMRSQLRALGQKEIERSEERLRAIESAKALGRKDVLLDLLVVGGVTLAQVVRDPNNVPVEIKKAFRLAYPGLAQNKSLSDAVDRMSGDQLVGLASGIKGKLFELELVDHLNNGGLPEGFHADLAQSATQPGWDIKILDAQDHVSELLQAKATQSMQYVAEALKRYPDIDVTTTTEVHAQLVALGLAQDIHNSGISEAVLQAKVDGAMQGAEAFDASDLVPSAAGLAVIALSVFMNKDATLREKGAKLGSRSAKAGATSAVGKMAMVATQTWWLGLIAGVGSRWLSTVGQEKREQYEVLNTALAAVQKDNPLLLGKAAPS